jgi:hypothetical protein
VMAYSSNPPGVALLVQGPSRIATMTPRASPEHGRRRIAHHLGLHVPSLFVALQGDRRGHPRQRWRLCAWRRSPFSVNSWSRSLSERFTGRSEAGNDRGGGAVKCASGRQSGRRAVVFNLGLPGLPSSRARSACITRFTSAVLPCITSTTNDKHIFSF